MPELIEQKSEDLIIEPGYGYYDELWEIPTKADTKYLSHGYYRYIGKFPPQIARELIKSYAKPGMTILDPMCGGGTTLIEARLAGCDVTGCDVNPVSLLISKVVSTEIDPVILNNHVQELTQQILQFDDSSLFHNPKRKKTIKLGDNEKYFTEDGLEKITLLMDWFDSLENEEVKDFFTVALLAILRQVSRANVKKMNVTIDETKKVRDVFETYMKQVKKMQDINSQLKGKFTDTNVELIKQDARQLPFPDESFDMVIIHPPYLSNTAFSESTQLQLAVMGIKQKAIWKDELKARGSYASVSDGLRKYLVGWHSILKEAYRVLKPGGICAIENGDGQIDYVRIPVGTITREFATDIGFSIEKHALHKINNNTGRTLTHKMKDHHIVVMRKGE
ncbi:TRM11 family SAM-dependent methyltransferase [Priestia aryabhattai]